MRRKRFAVLVATLVVVASALYGSGLMGASAEAGGDEQSFRWLAGTGMTELGFLCNLGGPPCPVAAMASSGETIEISGEGTLSIDAEDGDPEDVTGGGSFRRIDVGGAVIGTGTWTAEELISFASFGPSAGFPPTWEAGNALIEVELVSDVGGMEFDAVLRVGCILDPTDPDLPAGAIEGVRLDVEDLLNFDQDLERSTLFIRLAG